MATTKNGNIGYHKDQSGMYIQAAPLVCESCEEVVTRETIGIIEGEARVPNAGLHEVVICCRCVGIEEPIKSGWTLWKFQERHPEFYNKQEGINGGT